MPENKNALPIGTILNARYEIESLLGGGGFGLVYQARHTHLNTVVAIKELFPRDIVVRQGKAVHPVSQADVVIYQKVLSSFRKEGRNLASLGSCPSIIQCSDYFEENGTGYLVMEYVKGRSLRAVIRSYRESGKIFNEASLISLLNELLKGLKEVHKAGIQHMDIKPENIYVRETGGADELSNPVLLDFGASRSQTGHSTGSSLLVGTAPYAPIEQMHESGNMGPWTDNYALGITLYELMFRANEIPGCTERISDIHNEGTDPLKSAKSRGAEQYSEKFLRLVDKCIAIKAKDRPQNIEEIESLLTAAPLPEPKLKTSEKVQKHLNINTNTISNIAKYCLFLYIVICAMNIIQINLIKSHVGLSESNVLDTLNSLITLSSFFIIGRWLYLSSKINHLLEIKNLRHSPGWSVGWYFIPIANLWKPYQALKEIYKASFYKENWEKEKVPYVFPIWWTTWILGNALYPAINMMRSERGTSYEDINATLNLLIASFFFLIVCAIALFKIISIVSKNHQNLNRAHNE